MLAVTSLLLAVASLAAAVPTSSMNSASPSQAATSNTAATTIISTIATTIISKAAAASASSTTTSASAGQSATVLTLHANTPATSSLILTTSSSSSGTTHMSAVATPSTTSSTTTSSAAPSSVSSTTTSAPMPVETTSDASSLFFPLQFRVDIMLNTSSIVNVTLASGIRTLASISEGTVYDVTSGSAAAIARIIPGIGGMFDWTHNANDVAELNVRVAMQFEDGTYGWIRASGKGASGASGYLRPEWQVESPTYNQYNEWFLIARTWYNESSATLSMDIFGTNPTSLDRPSRSQHP